MVITGTEKKRYTADNYFKFVERMESVTDVQFEFAGGQIYPLQDGKPLDSSVVDYVLSNDFDRKEPLYFEFEMAKINHGQIISNLNGNLFIAFINKPFRVFSQAPNVMIEHANSFRVPDITITPLELEKNAKDQVKNPLVIMEVLSDSTASVDYKEKLIDYQSIPSLQNYILLSQDQPLLMNYQRINATTWQQEYIEGLEKELYIQCVDYKCAMKAIYANINFEEI